MVFHAPVQRRQGNTVSGALQPTSLSQPQPSRATRLDEFRSSRRPIAGYRDERSYSPLPALPTVLRAQSNFRPVPSMDFSPVSEGKPAFLTPHYRPRDATSQAPTGKGSLGFILGQSRTPTNSNGRMVGRSQVETFKYEAPLRYEGPRSVARGRLASDCSTVSAISSSYPSSPSVITPMVDTRQDSVRPVEAAGPAEKKKRKARICTTEGCTKYVVDHGLCIRHGGGKRCYIDGCDCRAQNRGLCWKHGGFTICKIDGCTKRAKSRGICWSHGGGTRCKRGDCSKIAVSNGLCWAHGGGKRCVFGKCRKPASERTNNYCNEHFALDDTGSQDGNA